MMITIMITTIQLHVHCTPRVSEKFSLPGARFEEAHGARYCRLSPHRYLSSANFQESTLLESVILITFIAAFMTLDDKVAHVSLIVS